MLDLMVIYVYVCIYVLYTYIYIYTCGSSGDLMDDGTGIIYIYIYYGGHDT